MSQISAIFGSDDDGEILNSLYIIANVSLVNPIFDVLLFNERFRTQPV